MRQFTTHCSMLFASRLDALPLALRQLASEKLIEDFLFAILARQVTYLALVIIMGFG